MTALVVLCAILAIALFWAWQVIVQFNFERAILMCLLKSPGWVTARSVADLSQSNSDRVRAYGALHALESHGFLESRSGGAVYGVQVFEYRVKPWIRGTR